MGLVVLAFVVAIRVRGFRVTAWSVALAVAYNGIVSLATPDDASSAGLVGRILSFAWGVAFAALPNERLGSAATTRPRHRLK
ncbi:MAG: hypothetical protein ACRDWA_03855 [Acidimicrobiia bacterium]